MRVTASETLPPRLTHQDVLGPKTSVKREDTLRVKDPWKETVAEFPRWQK